MVAIHVLANRGLGVAATERPVMAAAGMGASGVYPGAVHPLDMTGGVPTHLATPVPTPGFHGGGPMKPQMAIIDYSV